MINELMAANLSIIIETLRMQMIFLLQIFKMIFRDRTHENLVIQINFKTPKSSYPNLKEDN